MKSKTKWRQRKEGKGKKAEEGHKLCKKLTYIVHIACVEFKFAAQSPSPLSLFAFVQPVNFID